MKLFFLLNNILISNTHTHTNNNRMEQLLHHCYKTARYEHSLGPQGLQFLPSLHLPRVQESPSKLNFWFSLILGGERGS